MTSRTAPAQPATPMSSRVALAGIGLACAGLFVAARGGAASGSPAPLVMSGSMMAVVLATSAAVALDRSWLRRHQRSVGAALGLTLALFGVALGWIASSIGPATLPAWPLTLVVAAALAVPCVRTAARARG